ncbi:hypothetical protein QVD17_17123 [Tagetes erecta]|uniref:Uncharacterized protein n=1 Tax=Tagetes erecta TaxID=13708 RepID=A0AAD8KXT5_TARER|nr:hypothetical protein QVD17_17123 [Tagetes erecta]
MQAGGTSEEAETNENMVFWSDDRDEDVETNERNIYKDMQTECTSGEGETNEKTVLRSDDPDEDTETNERNIIALNEQTKETRQEIDLGLQSILDNYQEIEYCNEMNKNADTNENDVDEQAGDGMHSKICIGIACGLSYLYELDTKATKMLLNKDFDVNISYIGLAKLDEEKNTHISTRIV